MDPENGVVATTTSTEQTASSQSATPSTVTPPSPAAGNTVAVAGRVDASPPGSGGDAQTQPNAAGQATGAQVGLLSHLRSAGFSDLPSDEQQAAVALVNSLRQARQIYDQHQQISPYLEDYRRNARDFHEWQKSRVAATQAAAPAKDQPFYADYFKAPEYDPRWTELVTRDPATGRLTGPPDIVRKIEEYRVWRTQTADKLIDNPHEFIRPTVEKLAEQKAREIVQSELGRYREVVSARQFLEDPGNRWMYDTDAGGNLRYRDVYDPSTGGYRREPALTQYGQRFSQLVLEESQRGLPWEQQRYYADLRLRDEIARGFLPAPQNQNATHVSAAAQAQARPTPAAPAQQAVPSLLEQANAAFLAQRAARGSQATPQNYAPAPAQSVDLETMLNSAFARAGITAIN